MSTHARAAFVVATVMLAVAACSTPPKEGTAQSPPAAAPAPAPAAAPKSVISINAAMVRVVDHASHELWEVERAGKAPKTDADWANVVEHATQVATAGALVAVEGTGPNDRDWVQHPAWQRWARDLAEAGAAAIKAAEAKDLKSLTVANGLVVDACMNCHHQFKPALPSEGIDHSHAH
ncbi:MAG: hypothetical protein ABL971_00970 [Vicinamibacterales bacterium]